MRDYKTKKLLSLFIVIAMLMTMLTSSMFATTVFAASAEDVYSPWASWDIIMAENVYGLGGEGTYSNFQGNFTDTKFAPVFESLNKDFGADSKLNIINKDAVTRGEIISALYGIITEVLELDAAAPASSISLSPLAALIASATSSSSLSSTAIDYFVENGLINGRASGNYQLDQKCTTEEMIVFSVRVYEYLSYKLELDTKGLCWKVTGNGAVNTVYLLGSIHISDKSLYPLSKAVLAAYDKSAYLGVEANIYTISEEDIKYITELQMLTDGSTIKDYLSAEVYELYETVCEDIGLPAEVYNYIKPWVAWQTLLQALMGDDVSGDLGIDRHFLMKSFLEGKDIVEVESIRYQIDLFNNFSPELQEAMLASTLMSFISDESGDLTEEESEEMANAVQAMLLLMLNMVKEGDETALAELLTADRDYSNPIMEEYNTKLWDIRDTAMAETIELYLMDEDADGDYFIVVGAGHVIGETGMVKVLQEKGYTVERVK